MPVNCLSRGSESVEVYDGKGIPCRQWSEALSEPPGVLHSSAHRETGWCCTRGPRTGGPSGYHHPNVGRVICYRPKKYACSTGRRLTVGPISATSSGHDGREGISVVRATVQGRRRGRYLGRAAKGLRITLPHDLILYRFEQLFMRPSSSSCESVHRRSGAREGSCHTSVEDYGSEPGWARAESRLHAPPLSRLSTLTSCMVGDLYIKGSLLCSLAP